MPSSKFLAVVVATVGLAPWLAAQTTPLPSWKLQHFTSAQLADGTSDDSSDPNRDGVPNLLAYALGLTPFQDATAFAPAPSLAAGRLQLTFRQLTGATDLTYMPQVTGPLANPPSWTGGTTALISSTPISAGLDSVTVADPVLLTGNPRRFLRLQITRINFDFAGDGLLDDWQLKHFGTLALDSNTSPGADPEPDGFTNLEESTANTDPLAPAAANSAAVLNLSVWTPLR
jgi:hypothetical protein